MKSFRIIMVLMLVGILATGCSQEADLTAPDTQTGYDKNGQETLGPPSIEIATGSCFAQGGVGMVGKDMGILNIDVPAGTIKQVLLYWAGGTTGAPGDDTVNVNGNPVTGEMIHDNPINFFSASGVNYFFSAYRADITAEGWVTNGANSFEITEFDFDYTGGPLDENNGIGMLVIYDDGTLAEISVRDGLDMAFFQFPEPRDATVPQTFTFAAEPADRMAKMVIFSGSVGVGRPNGVKFTTSDGDDLRSDLLGSMDDLLWDTLCLEDVLIPAGDTSLTVELISTVSTDPLGASLGWVASGLSVPVTPPELACIGDYVWHDVNMDGIQDQDEMGIEGVVVHLMDCSGNTLESMATDADGYYMFCELDAGDYNIQFELPSGYVFSPMNIGGDPALDSDADETTGMTVCTTLDPGENDMTWDAGMYMPPELACIGDYVWHDVNMDGIQDQDEMGIEGVTVHLMDCDGNTLNEMLTDADGYYMFCDLDAGDYNIHFVLPSGYVFSPMNMGGDPALDSDADETTGMTACTTLDPGENDMTWDAGMYMPPEEGCTLTIGYWKNWTGLGPQPDMVSQYLPITLGDAGGAKSLDVTDVYIAEAVLEQKTYGKPNNGITKLYAQLLAAKLNFAAGASDTDVADYVTDADAFLADHDYMDWDDLSDAEVGMVNDWHENFDLYNNGDIGPGHCDDDDDDDDDEMEMFK